MYGVVGIGLLCLGLVVGQIAYIGAHRQPLPRWASDELNAHLVAPFIVTAIVTGVATLGTWLFDQGWRTQSLFHWAAMAAIVAAYVLLKRILRAWAARQPAPLTLVATSQPQDPGRPPQRPPLKKAA
jgi:Na+/H+-dicarboxylate symporter